MSIDSEWGEWKSAVFLGVPGEAFDVEYKRIGGEWLVRTRPRKPVVETVTLRLSDALIDILKRQSNDDTHTITLTKIDGVWQREAVLEEIK